MSKFNIKQLNKSVFIIAEISANHGQSFSRAASLIKQAKIAGADAVKFQTYTPDTMTINSREKYFQIKHDKWGGQTLYQLYQQTYLPWKYFPKLKEIAEDLGLVFFSAAFDKTAVDFLEKIKTPIHKVASFELVDLPLIEYMAKTKKPIIMSTGLATLAEVKRAVQTARGAGAKDIILLKCVSQYPAMPEDMNLKTIPHMKKIFHCPMGLSDHTLGIGAAIASVCLGARAVEKHITLSRKIKTADSFFSIEPREFKDLVNNIRIAEKAIGKVYYGPTPSQKGKRNSRRSLFVALDMKAGEKFTDKNIRSIRPGYGLPPKYLNDILKFKAKRDIKAGVPLSWEAIAK